MDSLFEQSVEPKHNPNSPLAELLRPKTLDEVVGQEHLIGGDGPLRRYLALGRLPSLILWGPPGTGKTTIASVVATSIKADFKRLSAVESGVKELREVIQIGERLQRSGRKLVLFIDEIHRYSKSQQDALLHSVESGSITLIGATTENPSFEVNAALLSRCQVYHLQPLQTEDLQKVLKRAILHYNKVKNISVSIEDEDALFRLCSSDARTLLNILENVLTLHKEDTIIIRTIDLEKIVQKKVVQYDKSGESHYDTISAFIKSMRGSDPDASLFWLAKMLVSGEDPKFIARRMLIFASEDIGNANPQALQVALSVFQAVAVLGMPEARITLAQGVTYLASSIKSNASYKAINDAIKCIEQGIDCSVPLHLRNAPTSLMKQEGYGSGYLYPHDFTQHFVTAHYFPMNVDPIAFYNPTQQGQEEEIQKRLHSFWPNRYNNNKEQ